MRRPLAWAALALLWGCDDGTGRGDAGAVVDDARASAAQDGGGEGGDGGPAADAAVRRDAGPGADAAVRRDAGPGSDAAVKRDAGPGPDAAVRRDAGPGSDAAVRRDAGPGSDAAMPLDTGPDADAATRPDAGPVADGGPVPDGALPDDAGAPPRPAPALAVPCADGDVYAAQAGAVAPGSVVACAPDDVADADAVRRRLADQPEIAVRSGYRGYRIAYRTERRPGVAGTGTARLWVPDAPVEGPRPVVVVTHGTVGLADRCAPSVGPPTATLDDLGLPWLAAGYVTVLPDYAGLGNAGVQGYGDAPDTARSVLDAGRAARAAVTPGSVDDAMVVAGHSQGGGAALNAQSWSRRYAPDMPVVAAVAFAGSAQENVTLTAYRFPGLTPIVGGAGVTRAVVALATYADAANIAGDALAPLAFHPDVRDVVIDAIRAQCIFGIVATLATPNGGYQPPNTAAQLIDPDWIDDVVACDRRDVCTDAARAFVERARSNEAVPDGQGAPVLMLSGADDAQQPLDRQQCTADYLGANGVAPTQCAFAGEDHFTLVEASAAHAVTWVRATLRGEAPPACPPGPAYPPCD